MQVSALALHIISARNSYLLLESVIGAFRDIMGSSFTSRLSSVEKCTSAQLRFMTPMRGNSSVVERGTCKICFSRKYKTLSLAVSVREPSRNVPRKGLGERSRLFPVGKGLAKRIVISGEINFTSRALIEQNS